MPGNRGLRHLGYATYRGVALQEGDLLQALHGRRLRGSRQPGLLQAEHGNAARRREEDGRRSRGEGAGGSRTRVKERPCLETGGLDVAVVSAPVCFWVCFVLCI